MLQNTINTVKQWERSLDYISPRTQIQVRQITDLGFEPQVTVLEDGFISHCNHTRTEDVMFDNSDEYDYITAIGGNAPYYQETVTVCNVCLKQLIGEEWE